MSELFIPGTFNAGAVVLAQASTAWRTSKTEPGVVLSTVQLQYAKSCFHIRPRVETVSGYPDNLERFRALAKETSDFGTQGIEGNARESIHFF
jgi:hypothetical protein